MTRSRMRMSTVTGLVLVLALGATAARCGGDAPRPQTAGPAASATRQSAVPSVAAPRTLAGAALEGPTRLRFLTPGWYVEVDAGTQTRVDVTTWLPRAGRTPLLLARTERGTEFGRSVVRAAIASPLPGSPPMVRIEATALTRVAPSADGVWLGEYLSRSRCTLREVSLDGRERRAPRDVPCGTSPDLETPDGLWVTRGPDAFVEATVGAGPSEYTSILLDPETLGERASVDDARIIDEHRVLVVPHDPTAPFELRDLSSGRTTTVPRPPSFGWPEPRVGSPSPDGRYLPLSFGEPGESPQVLDVWLLDLSTATPAWVHVPSMPAYTALKGTDLNWAADGRLVIVGQFHPDRFELVTWRPGDAQLALRPYRRPAAPDGMLGNPSFLAW